MKNILQEPLYSTIVNNLNAGVRELCEAFCVSIVDNYHLRGAAVARRQGETFRVIHDHGIFNPGETSFNVSNGGIVIHPGTNQPHNGCLPLVDTSGATAVVVASDDSILDNTALMGAVELLSSALALKEQNENVTKRFSTYYEMFKKSPALIAVINRHGDIAEWNQAAASLFGRDLSEGTVSYIDIIHEDDVPAIQKGVTKLYRTVEEYLHTVDHSLYAHDSSYRETVRAKIDQINILTGNARLAGRGRDLETDFSLHCIVDLDTLEIEGFIVSSTDILKKKTMRDHLEETERKYHEIFKLIPLFSMLIDTSGRTIEFNYVSAEDYGLDPNRESISYMDFIHEDDQKRAAALFIDLYARAVAIKNQWVKERTITREECAQRLRSLRIRNEPIRLVSGSGDKVFETEFSASLWISGIDLGIRGALISAIDVTERNSYRRKLEESERKYRELVEEKTRDIIFSLDDQARFVMVNSNIREKLGYFEDAVIGKNILDILYKDPIDKNLINRETFLENLERVLKEGAQDVRFKAVCDHKFLGEPVTLQFKLDPILENGKVTGVMGFASEISDDPLREFLESETLSFSIDNRLTIADEVSFRITRNLQKYLPEGRITLLRLGIREMIVNAIEHGNLGITYEEKSLAQKNQTYHDLLRERQMSEQNRKKKVHISYELSEQMVRYVIRDEGFGFNHHGFIDDLPVDANEQMLQHGRGIVITRSVFDEIRYNDTGNEVTLIAYFKK